MKLEKLGPVGPEEFWSAEPAPAFENEGFAAKTRIKFNRVRLRATVSCASAALFVCQE
jgi:hypothetical protein